MFSVNEHDVPPMPQKPPGKGGWDNNNNNNNNNTTERTLSPRALALVLEAFSKLSLSAGCAHSAFITIPIW